MRARLLCAALGALFSLTLVAPLAQAADSAKRKQVRELMQLSGAGQLGEQVMAQLIANFQRSFPDVPQSYWDKLGKRMDTNQLVNQIIPVYEKHFTIDDIKGIIAFYKSPVGKKFVSVQPQLVAESMQIGQAWGQNVAQKVVKELQARKK